MAKAEAMRKSILVSSRAEAGERDMEALGFCASVRMRLLPLILNTCYLSITLIEGFQ
jgi:hypothetical protein